ncbi:MAG TPA: hypothetical protein VKQ71_17290 [Acidimicrobiales bacterium]|nr:hypothetical protein [Acidimicrobiales bacterium]
MNPADRDVARVAVSRERSDPRREPDRTVDNALIDMLSSHAQREGAALASYQQLAEESGDEGLHYLVRLIMEDEARHHQQISEMLNNLHSFTWELDLQPKVPEMAVRDDPVLRNETERLLAFEKEDAKELRRLRKELRRSQGYPLLPLLVNLMLHDTAKHIDILRFVRSQARRR